MKWECLNQFSSTGYLCKNALGPGRDVLLDMQGPDVSLAPSLACTRSAPERIAELFITHHHSDHFFVHDALALARQGTPVHIGRQSWQDALENFVRLRDPAATTAAQALEATGRLNLLEPSGSMTLPVADGSVINVLWRSFPHGDGDRSCENLAFAFDDHVFSGDTSIGALFDPRHPSAQNAAELLGLSAAPAHGGRPACHVLCLDIAQLSRAEIAANPELNDRRRRNYYENHGILEDFIATLGEPRLHDFFAGLRTLVPVHLRRYPLEATAQTMRSQILEAARARGFTFGVCFSGLAE